MPCICCKCIDFIFHRCLPKSTAGNLFWNAASQVPPWTHWPIQKYGVKTSLTCPNLSYEIVRGVLVWTSCTRPNRAEGNHSCSGLKSCRKQSCLFGLSRNERSSLRPILADLISPSALAFMRKGTLWNEGPPSYSGPSTLCLWSQFCSVHQSTWFLK